MSGHKVLVIDDSATIRRLVDSSLSPKGYQVILAPTAEDGLRLVLETRPDVILLDHQLPGTTGYEVCCQLAEMTETRQTPVVVSSTLRKKAYVEYAEMPNVVDMLPKPYTAELLCTTVANAVDTGAMVVASQEQGTAVPEVIKTLEEPELAGGFKNFRLREILDFLNNGGKRGVLEVEGQFRRTYFFLDGGRIAGVTASGVELDDLVKRLPESLHSLTPVLNLTVGGRGGSDVDGMVELLDRKVLDPRLLRKLLRHQAAILTWDCFNQELHEFRFHPGNATPPLQSRLPLEVSLLALLIEGSLLCDLPDLPKGSRRELFVRQMLRGQNLDRAGVPAQHMKLLSLIAKPRSWDEMAGKLQWGEEELQRVLSALLLCDAVQVKPFTRSRKVLVFETNIAAAQRLREYFEGHSDPYACKVVKDPLALQMVLKREQPDALVFAADDAEAAKVCHKLYTTSADSLAQVKWCAFVPGDGERDAEEDTCSAWSTRCRMKLDGVIERPYHPDTVVAALDKIFGGAENSDDTQDARRETGDAGTATSEQDEDHEHDDQLCSIDA